MVRSRGRGRRGAVKGEGVTAEEVASNDGRTPAPKKGGKRKRRREQPKARFEDVPAGGSGGAAAGRTMQGGLGRGTEGVLDARRRL